MFQSHRNDFTKTCFHLNASIRALALCGALGVTALISACGGGGDGDSATTTATTGTSTSGTSTTGTTVAAVDKYPNVPTPTVTSLPSAGISDARNYPFLGADFNLKTFGFSEEEFLIEGKANSYDVASQNSITASAPQNAKIVTSNNPYKTRIMVYRPTDPAKFNGTVIVEWVNASNGWDSAIHWYEQKNMILRKGYAYVGVTAQNQTISGTNGLKAWSPTRYGTLDVTNSGKFTSEELSWDIFSQAAKAVRSDSKIMTGLTIKKVLAVGESQSGQRLSTYLNAYHPLTGNIFDGALATQAGAYMRTDLSIPIIKIFTETEFTTATNQTPSLQPDTEKLKTWFIAGATHSNLTSLLPRAVPYVRDFSGKMINDACSIPANSRVMMGHAYNAGIDRLEKYLNSGTAIPTSPQFPYVASATAPSVTRDSDDFIVGGVRYPDVAVPVALNSGANSACPGNSGSHVPFTKAKLDSLYPTHADYVSKVTTAANKAVADGFMLQDDAQDVIDNAVASIYGRKLNCGTLCADAWYFPQHPSILNLRWHIYLYFLPNRVKILAPVDDAAIKIATAYVNVDATTGVFTATGKMYLSQAIADLQQYANLIQDEATSGSISADTTTYLAGQANLLVTELQKLLLL